MNGHYGVINHDFFSHNMDTFHQTLTIPYHLDTDNEGFGYNLVN